MGSIDPQAVNALADAAGVGPVRAIVPMAGGANNRVFRVETLTSPTLLKSYFRHPDDPRDRLGTEFAFSRFAWENGVRCIPRPLSCDARAGLGLFEFVFGRTLHGTVAGEPAVDQAIDFFRTLNRAKKAAGAAGLPEASEACFSLDDHFKTVGRRVEQLQSITVGGVVDLAAASCVEVELVPAWRQVHKASRAAAAANAIQTERPLAPDDRCLSPSDFGFHNAILGNDGQLRFIDFEYAGWDDPAKLICDFFCQPAVPAPVRAFDRFVQAISLEMPDPSFHAARASLLLPAYRLKWACIMLNEFLPVGGSRRAFSGSPAERESRKISQLAKARAAIAAVLSTGLSTRKAA